MPSARDPFKRVQIGPNRLRLLGFQFISVRQNAPEFNSTAEVTAEVMLLLAVQGVTLNWHGTSEFAKTAEKLLKLRLHQTEFPVR